MQPWWWRSVAACASVVVVAGVAAAVATAVDADRAAVQTRAAKATSEAPAVAAPTVTPPPPVVRRVTDPGTGASVAVAPGWEPAPRQDVVPVEEDRFGVTLALADRGVIMIGALDPERVGDPTPEALGDEARRLVAAFADGTAPDAADLVDLTDDAATIAGRPAWTVVLRAQGGAPRTDGALIRVSSVAPAPGADRGVVALAVVLPGPDQDREATTAEDTVRSLQPVADPEPVSPEPVSPEPPTDR